MSTKQRYDIGAVKLARMVIENFNKLDLADLELVENGESLPITDEMLQQWHFIGLTNEALIEMRAWEGIATP